MSRRIRGGTRTLGIIGWPVDHSLSPAMHNAAFEALGLDWVYVGLPVPPGRVGEALEGLRTLGFAGANVTMPHKTDVANAVGELSDDARRLRAVNTLIVGEQLEGHNTDVSGFERFLRRDASFEPSGRSVLLFGAGGAARACALALARAGVAELTVSVRDPERAADLRAAVEGFDTSVRLVRFGDAVAGAADLIVNATPLGARNETLPIEGLRPDTVVVDLLYHPVNTPLQTEAKRIGCPTFGGLGLLLHQAALSFELWTGQVPPLDVMSAAAIAAIGERD